VGSITLYEGSAHHSNELFIGTFLTNFRDIGGLELPRITRTRTSPKRRSQKFGFRRFYEVRCAHQICSLTLRSMAVATMGGDPRR
jgi:hypothetical protein